MQIAASTGTIASRQTLGGYAMFAALLSAAGLPIYIHAPKFFVDEYGVSLAALGTVLFGLRLLDVVQDPLLGKLSAATAQRRSGAVALGVGVLCAGMICLFAIAPPVPATLWFALSLTLVFSAFSFLTISFYAQGVGRAEQMPWGGHLRLARWRETGALLGVCLAAVAPTVLAIWTEAPFVWFALGFALFGLGAAFLMQGEWQASAAPDGLGVKQVIQDGPARRLLLLALVNAAPVAVSSTLFLFFVESRLGAAGSEGLLLLLFFACAAASAPLWGALALRFGTKQTLLAAMALAVFAFGFALRLETGDIWAFALICAATGAAMGADLTLLPAAFAARMARISPSAAEGFGLWAFVSKLSLAFAAVALLPLLERRGFVTGGPNSQDALWTLSLLYAGVPCALKLVAIALLITTRLEDE